MKPTELKQVMSIKDKFSKNRHQEKIELCNLRFSQAMKMIERRDAYAKDRHKERLSIIFAPR